ncbi:MAG: prepilin-type N-terminal cleavage/methylation domain-containing protein, partial [Holophagales bacterium]|nr:prepilin-type N-terminal cleavage/methylation domain-containing protein [Holophagales bacterium]
MTRDKGFTLIELLIVVAIIGVIVAIAIPYLLNAIDRAKQTMTVERVSALGKYVEQYIMDHNDVGCPKVASASDLIPIFKAEEINFNDTAVEDGWGYDLIYQGDSTMGGRNYTVISYG